MLRNNGQDLFKAKITLLLKKYMPGAWLLRVTCSVRNLWWDHLCGYFPADLSVLLQNPFFFCLQCSTSEKCLTPMHLSPPVLPSALPAPLNPTQQLPGCLGTISPVSASLLPDLKTQVFLHQLCIVLLRFHPPSPLPPTATHTPGTAKAYRCLLAILGAESKYLPSKSRVSQQTSPLS